MSNADDSNNYWTNYDPSSAFAIAATVLFGLVMIPHIFLLFHKRAIRYMWPFVFGVVLETVGYVFRILSAQNYYSLPDYAVQLLLQCVLLSRHTLIYGRLLINYGMQTMSFLPKKVVTPLFVTVDVLSFIIQIAGGVMITSTNLQTLKNAANVLKVGFIIQIGIGATVVFIRTLYRFLEYVIKNADGVYPLNSHEAQFIVFDFLFMLPLSIYFAVDYPKKYVDTRPPVDLYCYYLFLQREGAEDTLDFWLDVQQHENLCRAYFKDLRKSGRTVKEDWPRYHEYARTRGSLYGPVTGIRKGEDAGEDTWAGVESHSSQSHGGHRGETSGTTAGGDNEKVGLGVSGMDDDEKSRLSVENARYQQRTPSPTSNGPAPAYPLSPTLRALYPHDESGVHSRHAKRSSTPAQPFIARNAAINRTDLIASAERIYSRYLMPGADKEVYLPAALRIDHFPLSSSTLPAVTHPDYDAEADAQARVPDMFHAQKEYCYRAMELDTFPRFLRAKAFGNLTPVGAMVRLAFGLLTLWVALSTAFAFIFLNTKPKVKRLWIILPFTVSIINIVAFGYDLDPLLVFMGLSETTPFRTIGIREPYVRKLLFGRALWVTFLSAAIVAILTVIFWAVPGHRL
ncbi:bud site selection-related protein [Pseudohyphozyma bogoriensis]|nr:bud site selection-related protein [Pseudohyphozyma bogoriensis]